MMQLATFTLVSGYDTNGVYGSILHYALVIAISGASLLAFIYFWCKGKLDMDEGPKYQMLNDTEEKRDGRSKQHPL